MRSSWACRVAISTIACLTITACSATASPSPGGTGLQVSPAPTPVPTPTPLLTPRPTPRPVSVWDDPAFQERSRAVCDRARPKDLYDIAGPDGPAEQTPGYDGIHIVVLELRDPDGAIGPPPPLQAGEAYYYEHTVDQLNAYRIHTIFPEQVDLLACLALRAGEPQFYSTVGGSFPVAPVGAIVWMVDPGTGARVGEPWLTGEPRLGDVLSPGATIRLGRTWLDDSQQEHALSGVVPNDLGIAKFLGLAGLPAGGFQSGVGCLDDPSDLTLPEGISICTGGTDPFVLRLVVLENGSEVIDFVEIFCAFDRVVGRPIRVAANVPVSEWRFEAASADVSMVGEFHGLTYATGTIRALSASATACGIPVEGDWLADLTLDVVPAGDGYVASVRAD
jgi:hypothetical protein